jgi:hypothetical protein
MLKCEEIVDLEIVPVVNHIGLATLSDGVIFN